MSQDRRLAVYRRVRRTLILPGEHECLYPVSRDIDCAVSLMFGRLALRRGMAIAKASSQLSDMNLDGFERPIALELVFIQHRVRHIFEMHLLFSGADHFALSALRKPLLQQLRCNLL